MLIHAVTDYIITRKRPASHPKITPLSIEKLVYYAQGWHLAIRDELLFDEDIQAWRLGPVVPSLYKRFRFLRDKPISSDSQITNPKGMLAPASMAVIDQVLSWYGQYSGPQLVEMTHKENPWIVTWGDRAADAEGHDVIDLELINSFFQMQRKCFLDQAYSGIPSGKSIKLLESII
jgi:uncharacterized phage-associated protein